MAEDPLANLSPEEQERLDRAEAHALYLLRRKMREGRWYPRRHQQLAFLLLFGLAAMAVLGSLAIFLLELIVGKPVGQ